MSFRIPATNNYFGLSPVSVGSGNNNFQVNSYLVSSSEGTEINPGDVCTMTTIGTARVVTGAYVATSSQTWLGVAASRVPANGGSTAATLLVNTSQMLLVYDSALQYFSVCDTTSGVIGVGLVGLGKNYAILATGCVGSTGSFQSGLANARSVMAISGVTATAAGAVHLIGLDPVEQGVYSTVANATAASASNVRKWLVQPIGAYTAPSTGITSVVNTTS